MELIIIIAVVVGLGYFAFKKYTRNVTVDEEIVAPYKIEAPVLEPAQELAVAETHEKETNWPFPTADKPTAEQKPVAAITPAKKPAPAKKTAAPKKVAAPVKKAPAKQTAKPKAVAAKTPAKKPAKPKK